MFGVMGSLRSKDDEKSLLKVDIDKETEEMKIHNPYFGLTFLAKELKGVNKN